MFSTSQLKIREWDDIIQVLCDMAIEVLPSYPHERVPDRSLTKIMFIQRGTMEVEQAAKAIKERLAFVTALGVVLDVSGASDAS